MNVRAIRTADDHAWALTEIQKLWDKVEPGTPEGDRFEVLSTLIDAYERVHFPVPPPEGICVEHKSLKAVARGDWRGIPV
jgi:HTH-type transcriptional regulator/antitoxin HigA